MSRNTKIILLIGLLVIVPVVIIGPRRKMAYYLEHTDLPNLQEQFLEALYHAFGHLDDEQRYSVKMIIKAFVLRGYKDGRHLSYILATAYHESRLRPIEEIRANPERQPELFALQNRYWYSGYYGRGFVQLTWRENYVKMGEELGVNLVDKPDRALDTDIAANAIVAGMMKGMFTGQNLGFYINDVAQSYYNARRVVNGTDRAQLIKDYTVDILENL